MACDVDTGAVFKRPVHCFGCGQAFYFTLRKIAEAKKLACPLCGSDIDLTDKAYGFVVTSVKETIALIDQFAASGGAPGWYLDLHFLDSDLVALA